MKKIIGICFMVLSPFSTNTWANDKDPYFFLNPKITYEHPIEIPFKDINKKGGVVSTFFWKIPKEKPKLFNIIPFGYLIDTISLKIDIPDKNNNILFINDYFEKINSDKQDIFLIEIFKIKENLNKELVFQKKINSLPLWYINENNKALYKIKQLDDHYEYGLYQIKITSLLNMPNITDSNSIKFHLLLFSKYNK